MHAEELLQQCRSGAEAKFVTERDIHTYIVCLSVMNPEPPTTAGLSSSCTNHLALPPSPFRKRGSSGPTVFFATILAKPYEYT